MGHTHRQCVAVCCGVLRCVAVCCDVLRWVAVCVETICRKQAANNASKAVVRTHTQCGAVWCGVLQCVAVCCSVLRGVRIIEQSAAENSFKVAARARSHCLLRCDTVCGGVL